MKDRKISISSNTALSLLMLVLVAVLLTFSIAVTANAFAEDIDKTTKAGMNGHISKPIDVALLYQALEKCIKHE